MNKLAVKYFVFIIISLLLIQGCLNNESSKKLPAPPPPVQNEEISEISNSLTKGIRSIQGVEKVSVIVFGRLAIIGINFEDSNRSYNEKIKGSVIEFAQAHPTITQALTTSEPDVVARIEGVSKELKNGRPITDFYNEIGDILNRLD